MYCFIMTGKKKKSVSLFMTYIPVNVALLEDALHRLPTHIFLS